MRVLGGLLVVAALLGGCSSSGQTTCTPNVVFNCTCPDTTTPGTKVCREDGKGLSACGPCNGRPELDAGLDARMPAGDRSGPENDLPPAGPDLISGPDGIGPVSDGNPGGDAPTSPDGSTGPDLGPPGDGGASTARTLAPDQLSASAIAVNATHVFWTIETATGRIMRVPLSGGPAETLATDQSLPNAIALDDTSAYWTNRGDSTVAKTPLAGSGATMLGPTESPPSGRTMAVNAQSIFFGCNDAVVRSMDIAGGMPSFVADGSGAVDGLVIDAANVYWTSASAGQVYQSPLNFPDILQTSNLASPIGVTVDNRAMYFTNSGDGTIMSRALTGGFPDELASGQGEPVAITHDGTRLYWANSSDGRIMTMPIAGGPATTLVAGEAKPVAIAIDATSVYWVSQQSGEIRTAPR